MVLIKHCGYSTGIVGDVVISYRVAQLNITVETQIIDVGGSCAAVPAFSVSLGIWWIVGGQGELSLARGS